MCFTYLPFCSPDHAAAVFLKLPSPDQGLKPRKKNSANRSLTGRARHQAMLTAIIILALLSLLVATEADPASPPVSPEADEPARPTGKDRSEQKSAKPNRLAA